MVEAQAPPCATAVVRPPYWDRRGCAKEEKKKRKRCCPVANAATPFRHRRRMGSLTWDGQKGGVGGWRFPDDDLARRQGRRGTTRPHTAARLGHTGGRFYRLCPALSTGGKKASAPVDGRGKREEGAFFRMIFPARRPACAVSLPVCIIGSARNSIFFPGTLVLFHRFRHRVSTCEPEIGCP